MPTRRSRSAVAGPTPGITVTCIGRSRSRSVPGATTTRPSGLSRSLATLAMNFDVPMPTEAVSPPVASATPAAQLLRERGHRRRPSRSGSPAASRSTNASSSDSGSTSGETSRSSPITTRAGVAVGVEPAGEERRVRAARPGLAGRHGRADAVLARLVRRRGHHPAAADAADHDRLAAQRGLVALLDRREERVQVQVEDRGVVAHGRNVPPGADVPAANRPQRRARARSSTGRARAGAGCRRPWGASSA